MEQKMDDRTFEMIYQQLLRYNPPTSNCCGAPPINNTGLCAQCKKPAEFTKQRGPQ